MMRNEVSWFAGLMEHKLSANDHKGGWDQDTVEQLLHKLECEVLELKNALEISHSGDEILSECVDIANFAMMIADKVVRK